MRFRIALVVGIIAALAVSFATVGQTKSGFKITGGGQTDFGTTGPGDTIAFTAQGEGEDVKGQVQYIDRDAGEIVAVYHGTVTCLEAVATETENSQGAGILGGTWTTQGAGDGTAGEFEIFVEDNGEPNQGSDVIFIDQNDLSDCSDDDDEEDGRTALGRGNVQVHSYTAPE